MVISMVSTCATSRLLMMSVMGDPVSRARAGSVEQRDRAGPAGRSALDLVREARDREPVGRQLLEIAQLLHVAVRDLPPSLVPFPDDRGIARLEPALARVHERRVPAPGVDAGD